MEGVVFHGVTCRLILSHTIWVGKQR
jgi:hypothetical protein